MPSSNRASDTASDSSSRGSASGENRLRDALRLLRCLERVEISGTSLNWDAKKCFVLLVLLRDTDSRRQAYAQGETRRSPTPFQIERTQGELTKLLNAMRHWCAKPHVDQKPCAFCSPVVSGALVAEAIRAAQDEKDIYEPLSEDDLDSAPIASCCFGFLPNPLGKRTLKPESDDEWEAWLNGVIAHVRNGVDIQCSPTEVCEGARHVPVLLARFLLDSFLPDAIA